MFSSKNKEKADSVSKEYTDKEILVKSYFEKEFNLTNLASEMSKDRDVLNEIEMETHDSSTTQTQGTKRFLHNSSEDSVDEHSSRNINKRLNLGSESVFDEQFIINNSSQGIQTDNSSVVVELNSSISAAQSQTQNEKNSQKDLFVPTIKCNIVK